MALALEAHGLRTQAQAPASPTRPLVEIRTELGVMVVALYNETPQHRDNFLKLVREHAYDSLLFHRIIPGFMAQGGDPASRHATAGALLGEALPAHTLPAEIVPGLVHTKGALGATRGADDVNPDKRSDGSRFHIVQGTPFTPDELDQVAARNARYGSTVRYSEEQRKDYAQHGGTPRLDGAYTIFGRVVEGLEVLDAICAVACDGRDRPLTDIHTFMRVLE